MEMWATCWLAGVSDKITERTKTQAKITENIRAGNVRHTHTLDFGIINTVAAGTLVKSKLLTSEW